MRLRTLMTIAFLSVAEGSLLTGLAAFGAHESNRRSEERDSSRRTDAERLARVASDALLDASDVSILNYLRSLKKDPLIVYALVAGADGTVHLDTGLFDGTPRREPWVPPADAPASPGASRRTLPPSFEVEEWSAQSGPGGSWAAIGYDAARTRAEEAAALLCAARRLGAAGAAASVLAALAAWALAGALARPLELLASAAERVGEGDFDVRVPRSGPAELRRLAAAFDAMAARLAAAEESRLNILSGLTHDLRSPLAVVAVNAQVAADSHLADAERRAAAAAVAEEAARLGRLVDDLTDLAKARLGVLPLRKEPLSFAELLEAARRSIQPLARKRDILVEVLPPPQGAEAPGDPDHIQRVLSNLVANAVRHTPPGGAVNLSAHPGPHHLVVSVKDTGPGLPEELERSLAAPGRQGLGGPGLGLRLSKELVAAHGGRLTAKRRTGGGAAVAFTLPLDGRPCTEDCR